MTRVDGYVVVSRNIFQLCSLISHTSLALMFILLKIRSIIAELFSLQISHYMEPEIVFPHILLNIDHLQNYCR